MKEIIYITYQKIRENFKEEYFINRLIIENRKFEYWDLSEMYDRKYIVSQPDYVKPIRNQIELIKNIHRVNTDNSVFIVHITYNGHSLKLYRQLTVNKCFIVFISRKPLFNPVPADNLKKLKYRLNIRTLKGLLNSQKLKKILKNNLAFYYKKVGLVKPFDIVFSAGYKGIEFTGVCWEKDYKESKIVDIRSVELEKSMQLNIKKKKKLNTKFAVFLDQYLPFHPDFEILGNKTVPVKEYYDSLNQFFAFIEEKYKLDIIIAAHPKAQRYKNENFFKGKDIQFNKTCELVSSCEFVLAHYSTSINYSIIFNKPIIFVTSELLNVVNPSANNYILQLGKLLKQSSYTITNAGKNVKLMDIDKDVYNKYYYDFLSIKDISNTDSSIIFIDTMDSII